MWLGGVYVKINMPTECIFILSFDEMHFYCTYVRQNHLSLAICEFVCITRVRVLSIDGKICSFTPIPLQKYQSLKLRESIWTKYEHELKLEISICSISFKMCTHSDKEHLHDTETQFDMYRLAGVILKKAYRMLTDHHRVQLISTMKQIGRLLFTS